MPCNLQEFSNGSFIITNSIDWLGSIVLNTSVCFLLSLTSNKDVSTILFIVFSHSYTDCVEAFIFFIEMRKCQCCPISAPMCFHPFWWRNRCSWGWGRRSQQINGSFSLLLFPSLPSISLSPSLPLSQPPTSFSLSIPLLLYWKRFDYQRKSLGLCAILPCLYW